MPENTVDPRLEEIERLFTEAGRANYRDAGELLSRMAEQTKQLLDEPGGHELLLGQGSAQLVGYLLRPYSGFVDEFRPEDFDIVLSRPDAREFYRSLRANDLTPNQVSKLLAVTPSDELPDVVSRHGGKLSRADWQYVFSQTPDSYHRIDAMMQNLPRSDHPEYEAIVGDAIDNFLGSGKYNSQSVLDSIIPRIVKTAPKESRAKIMDRLLKDHGDLDYSELTYGWSDVELEPRHVAHFLRDPNMRWWALSRQPLTEGQVRRVLNDPDFSVDDLRQLPRNEHVTLSEQQQHRLIDLGVGESLVENYFPRVAPSVRQRLVTDPNNFYSLSRTPGVSLSDEEWLYIFQNIDKVSNPQDRKVVFENVIGRFAESSDPKLVGLAADEALKDPSKHWLKQMLAEKKDLPGEVAVKLADHWKDDESSYRYLFQLIKNPSFDDDEIKRLFPNVIKYPLKLGKIINKRLALVDPDAHHQESVGVKFHGSKRFALGQLRKLRDLAYSKPGQMLTRKDLGQNVPEPIVRAKLLDNKGNLSADKIQAFIDSLPETRFNVSHGVWRKVQRHSPNQTNKVFRVNLTNEHVRQLKEAGVWQTYLKMNQASKDSRHPVTDHTLGWVRWSGNKKNNVFIDEIQSDFGQSFVRQAAQQAAQQGLDPEEAAKRAEQEWPEEHYKIIKKILFQDRHPNEVIHQAFEQYLRDKGYAGKLIHMWEAEGKKTISLSDKDKPVPGHMAETYRDIPKRHGYEPATYGELEIQDNPEHHSKPTLKTILLKAEAGVEPDILYYFGKRPGLTHTPAMAQCWFSGADVDPFVDTRFRYIVQLPSGRLYNLDEDRYRLLKPRWKVEYGQFANYHFPTMEEVVEKLKEGGFIGHYGHHSVYPGAVVLYEPAALLAPEPDKPLLQRHLEKSERLDPRVATAAIQMALRDESAPQESAVAAEALWYLLGGADSEYVPMTGFHEGQPHWWLAKREDPQAILDPAVLRFESLPDYSQGRPASFLSEDAASPRAQALLDAIQAPATGNRGTWDPKDPDITKFEQELAEFKKAIDPTHLSDLFTIDKLARRDDSNDLHVIDHTPHLAIDLPHIDRIRDFQENILEAPAVISPSNAKIAGAFEKRLFRSPATQYKYLVKPYHERLFMGYRHGFDVGQGWSEMVNQALYHAGGIGHLHGLNHATEYNLGGDVLPLLVSSFDTVLTDHVKRLQDNKFAEQFDPHALGRQAARIAVMDYLSDNTDRHGENWLVGLDPDGSSRLLAIDHSFCYQYHRYHGKLFEFFENSFKQVDKTQQTDWNSHAREAAKWWLGVKDTVAKEFNNHIGLIRRPAVRDRIKNEFERRHGILSRWAEQAATTPNPHLPLVMAKQDW